MRAYLTILVVIAGAGRAWAGDDAGAGSGSDDHVQEITPDDPTPAPAPAPAPAPTPTPAPAPVPAPATVRTMDEMMVPQSRLRFTFHFFGDTSASFSSEDHPHTGFELGSLVLHLMGDLSPTVDALTEDVIETTEEGLKAEVEQLAIRWRHGPGTLEVGRFHTDIGYWNTAYHHGLWLQTPIERPHVLRFEDDGGLVPVHWVGAHYTLQIPAGSGNLRVVLGIANGRGAKKEDVQVLGDTNDAKALLAKVRIKNAGFEMGIGAIADKIAPADMTVRPALPATSITELIGNAYTVANTEAVLLVAEGYGFLHRAAGKSYTTLAGVALLGVHATSWWMPYVQAEAIYADDADPYWNPVPGMPTLDVYQGTLGMRFDISTWSAFKLEGRYARETGVDDYGAVANWSFGL